MSCDKWLYKRSFYMNEYGSLIAVMMFLSVLFSCQSSEQGGVEMIIEDPAEVATIKDIVRVRETQHNNDEISIRNEFKSIEYVRIDNRRVIGKIIDMAFTKDYIFLMLSHHGGIMKYDRKGNFIKQIAWEGEGPEQVNTKNIFVDELRKRVYVIQFARKYSVAVFSFDGKFLENLSYPFEKISIMAPLGDELFFTFYKTSTLFSDTLNYGSGVFDLSGNTIYKRKSYIKQCDSTNCLVKHCFSFLINKAVLYMIDGSNIIYRATRDTIIPTYYLDLQNSLRAKISHLSYYPQAYSNFLTESYNDYIFLRRSCFFETDSCLYLYYSDDPGAAVVQYNRKEKRTRSCRPEIKRIIGVRNDIDQGVPIWPKYKYEKENIYVQTVSGGEIQDMKDLGYLGEDAPAIYHDMNEDSNPLVIIYKCN